LIAYRASPQHRSNPVLFFCFKNLFLLFFRYSCNIKKDNNLEVLPGGKTENPARSGIQPGKEMI